MTKTVGVLGGLGPMATVYFYEMVVRMTEAQKDQDHIDMVIVNKATTPDRTAYIIGESKENPSLDLIDNAQKLEKFGVDMIAIPCNTAHYFIDEVRRAVEKWRLLTGADRNDYTHKVDKLISEQHDDRQNFLVRFRDKLIPVSQSEIAYCYTSEEKVYAYGYNGERYLMEYTLEALHGMLSQKKFYRVNRQFIISRDAVVDISVWFGSRLSVNMKVEIPEKIIVPKARVSEFKQWLKSGQE